VLIISSFIVGGITTLAILRFTPLVSSIVGTNSTNIITKDKTKVYEKSSLAPAVQKIYDAVYLVQVYNREELTGSVINKISQHKHLLKIIISRSI
jgi:hypothetical protein